MTKCKDKKDIDKQLENKYMKSIKEKAEENCIKYGNLGNVAYQEFEAGANYVLDAITECMPKTHSFNPYETIDIITSMIKELKKK